MPQAAQSYLLLMGSQNHIPRHPVAICVLRRKHLHTQGQAGQAGLLWRVAPECG